MYNVCRSLFILLSFICWPLRCLSFNLRILITPLISSSSSSYTIQGRIQDFKLRGAHLKQLRRAEGGANIFGMFPVNNHDLTPKNHIFSNFRGGAPGAPPPGSAPLITPLISSNSSSHTIDETSVLKPES